MSFSNFIIPSYPKNHSKFFKEFIDLSVTVWQYTYLYKFNFLLEAIPKGRMWKLSWKEKLAVRVSSNFVEFFSRKHKFQIFAFVMCETLAEWRFFYPFAVSMTCRQMVEKNLSYSRTVVLVRRKEHEFLKFSFKRNCATKWGEIHFPLELRRAKKKVQQLVLKNVGTLWERVSEHLRTESLILTNFFPSQNIRSTLEIVFVRFNECLLNTSALWFVLRIWCWSYIRRKDAVFYGVNFTRKVEFEIIFAPSTSSAKIWSSSCVFKHQFQLYFMRLF